jgi:hypothetical protein
MTPKEKAKELVDMFILFSMDNHIEKYAILNAKQCALICIDEILEFSLHSYSQFLKEVREEIVKL